MKKAKNEVFIAGYTVQPKNKEELMEIIEDTIKKEGNRCDLNFIDTSLITDMSGLFGGGPSEFNGIISKWDTSNVRDMSSMFSENLYFEGDLSEWDVSNVINMDHMFYRSAFDKNISEWNVSYGVNMFYIFKDSELERKDAIPEWYKS